MALFIIGSYAAKPHIPVYGAEWDGSSNPAWTRTDDAVGFADPNPYYSGMSGTPSSPFDDIMPWAGMRIVEDADAGTLVEIPKYWYKWTYTGDAMKLQISENQFDGSLCSPAHRDRGDGVGERDYVYIGRYSCASSYKSITNEIPAASKTRETFRTNIHNIGSNIWQNDYAMWWTIRMLYLVEYAHWDSQSKIGYGGGYTSDKSRTGYTDNMLYNTGTTVSSRISYGIGQQYRYIEGLWGNVQEFIDGIRVDGAKIYIIDNPADFSDSRNGKFKCNRTVSASSGNIKSFAKISDYPAFPNAMATSQIGQIYVCDTVYSANSQDMVVFSGGMYGTRNLAYGLFEIETGKYDLTATYIGSRLMVLPPSRLTA